MKLRQGTPGCPWFHGYAPDFIDAPLISGSSWVWHIGKFHKCVDNFAHTPHIKYKSYFFRFLLYENNLTHNIPWTDRNQLPTNCLRVTILLIPNVTIIRRCQIIHRILQENDSQSVAVISYFQVVDDGDGVGVPVDWHRAHPAPGSVLRIELQDVGQAETSPD